MTFRLWRCLKTKLENQKKVIDTCIQEIHSSKGLLNVNVHVRARGVDGLKKKQKSPLIQSDQSSSDQFPKVTVKGILFKSSLYKNVHFLWFSLNEPNVKFYNIFLNV